MNSSFDTSLKDIFLAPLFSALENSLHSRACPSLSDDEWLLGGLQRCLDPFASGRDYLQKIGLLSKGLSTYFDSLKSERRCRLVKDISLTVQNSIQSNCCDAIAEHIPQLDGYDIWAGDGHWHSHATHEKKINGKYYATGHLYGLNLRSGCLHHLTTSDQDNKLKEHDLSGLKRLPTDELRVHAKKGRKVIWVWDKAGIDFRQWYHWKNNNGIYFISLEKENMKLDDIAIPRRFDRESQANAGVIADEDCATSAGYSVRRVTYFDPVTGKNFKFITTVTAYDIPPGAIAQLYRMRWDIEKVFDDVKNKFQEQKAWATTQTAKTVQAELICLTFNLTRNLERIVAKDYNVTNEAEDKRRNDRMAEMELEANKNGADLPLLYQQLIRATQISVKFIRWVRYQVLQECSNSVALDELKAIYAKL